MTRFLILIKFGFEWRDYKYIFLIAVYIVGDVAFDGGLQEAIADLSVCHRVNIMPQVDKAVIRNAVSDRIGMANTLIYLLVPADLRQAVELDLPKLEAKKLKLIKELDKMNKMISGDNYKVKATAEAQQSHAQKVTFTHSTYTFIVIFYFCRYLRSKRSWRE